MTFVADHVLLLHAIVCDDRHLTDLTASALPQYPGLGLEVFSVPTQAWVVVTTAHKPFPNAMLHYVL